MGADLRGVYDVNDRPSSGIETLPAGMYTVKITDGDWKDTNAKNGQYLQLDLTVADGEHEGAVIIDRLNLKNQSQEAVRIARERFAALREAVGVRDPHDIVELTNIRFQVALRIEKYTNSEGEERTSNRVQRYIKMGEATTPRQRPDDPPWSRNAPKPQPPKQPPLPAMAAAAPKEKLTDDDFPFPLSAPRENDDIPF